MKSEDDSDFDPDSTLSADQKQKMAEEFIQEWVSVLSRDDLMSLVITLHYLLDSCGVLQTVAASKIATLIGKGERIVRVVINFFKNAGSFPDSEQGHYQRKGILWQHEELCEAARDYVRSNAVVKDQILMLFLSAAG